MKSNCFVLVHTAEMRVVEIVPDWQDEAWTLKYLKSDDCYPCAVFRAYNPSGVELESEFYNFSTNQKTGVITVSPK